MYYVDDAKRQLVEYQLDSLDVAYILTEGNVDFSKSDTKSVPCKTYIVDSELKNKEWTFTVKNCSDKATIQNIEIK